MSKALYLVNGKILEAKMKTRSMMTSFAKHQFANFCFTEAWLYLMGRSLAWMAMKRRIPRKSLFFLSECR